MKHTRFLSLGLALAACLALGACSLGQATDRNGKGLRSGSAVDGAKGFSGEYTFVQAEPEPPPEVTVDDSPAQDQAPQAPEPQAPEPQDPEPQDPATQPSVPQATEPQDPATQPSVPQATAPAQQEEQDDAYVDASQPAVSGSGFTAQTELALLEEINSHRASLGLGTLQYSNLLTTAARTRAQELVRTGHWDHTRPDLRPWQTVIQEDVPVPFRTAGENLASMEFNDPKGTYQFDAAQWFSQWYGSPGHYDTMTKAEFTHVGIGIYYELGDDGFTHAIAAAIFCKF